MTKPTTLSLALGLALITTACAEKKAPAPPAPAEKPAPPAAPAAGEVLASGTLNLPEGSTATGKVVFVSLRPAGGKGPPIAALRLPAGPFPLAFQLTSNNVVAMGGQARPVPDEFVLKATLDVDGNPMQRSPDDLVVEHPTKKGSTGLALTLGTTGG